MSSPTLAQREVLSASSRRIALRPMNGRSSASMPLSIQPKPSSFGVTRSWSVNANRLDENSTLISTSPASMRRHQQRLLAERA